MGAMKEEKVNDYILIARELDENEEVYVIYFDWLGSEHLKHEIELSRGITLEGALIEGLKKLSCMQRLALIKLGKLEEVISDIKETVCLHLPTEEPTKFYEDRERKENEELERWKNRPKEASNFDQDELNDDEGIDNRFESLYRFYGL